ncbi:MAG TPA: oligosaccharide flippase family protein [Candidatus Acidoferrum sp.]|jgi:O-antigen/teichoic acid export membrane protein/glycosyltransferase involved in cell wall biosynthesis
MSVNLRNIGGNALSILSSDVLNRATSFVLYAMVARHLGALEFGQLSLALSLFYMFQVSAAAGLKVLIVRQVAKDRSQTRLYFNNGCAVVACSSLVSLAALFLFVRLMHYSPTTNGVVMLLSLGLLPYSVSSVCEGIFQAWEKMRYIAWVNVPANIAKMAAAYLLLVRGRGLYTVILVLLVGFFVVAVAEVWLVLARFPAQPALISLRFCWTTLRSSFTFLAIDKVLAIEASLNIILLSKLAGETEVGLYSAAAQLLVPLALVYLSIVQSIFPVMCRKVQDGFPDLRRIAEQAIEVLLMLAVPAVAGIFFFGQWGLSVLYKNPAFLRAVPALRIMAWILIFQVFSYVLGQVLLATHREKVTLRIVIVDVLITLTAGTLLIWRFGLLGAAMSLLLTRLAAAIQHYVPVSRLCSGISFGKIVWKPFVAATCMIAYLTLAQDQPSIVRAVLATIIYAAALLALEVVASGGLTPFRNKYLPGSVGIGMQASLEQKKGFPPSRDSLRVALVSYDFGEYSVRLASALANQAEVLLVIPESMVGPHLAELSGDVRLLSFRNPRLRQPVRQAATLRTLLTKINEFAPDVIHYQGTHLWFDLIFPLLRRCSRVFTIHDFKPHPGDRLSQKTPLWIEMFARRHADELIVHSQQVRDLVTQNLPGTWDRISVIPHIQIGKELAYSDIQEEQNLVLFFGRIWEYKGLEYLIRAEPLISSQVPNVRILIAGQGEDFSRYARMMVHPERFIVHNEYIPEEHAAEYFRRASVVALPYIEASQSGVIPIAYSAGRPVVATNVGGLPEMVEHGQTGYLVGPRDVLGLAESITRLLLNPGLRHRMGENAKRKIEAECSPAVVAQKTLEVYRRAVERFHPLRERTRTNSHRPLASGSTDPLYAATKSEEKC